MTNRTEDRRLIWKKIGYETKVLKCRYSKEEILKIKKEAKKLYENLNKNKGKDMSEKEDLIEVIQGTKKALCDICDKVEKQIENDILTTIEDLQLSLALQMQRLGKTNKIYQ